jgi:UDPglucose 6-dehydrogenase
MKIGIVGQGVVGSAMERLFTRTTDHSLAIYDKFKPECNSAEHMDAINRCDLGFISVPTPASPNGLGCDLSAVEECVSWILAPMCIRSTIIPGTCDRLSAGTGKALSFSPEYLGESSAHPWPEDAMCGFMIAGGPDHLLDLVEQAYRPAVREGTQFLRTTALTAEICKYMENCFLATKVAFVNQFYDIANAFHVDYLELRKLWLADPRIGESHTSVMDERGFRGRCLPKDISAMISAMQLHGGAPLLEAVRSYNDAICAAADRR